MDLKTGFEKLDNLIKGINGSDYITISSRPGVGKSTFVINIINNVSKQTNDKILYFNLETSKKELENKIKGSNVEIIDTPSITITEIKDKCEKVAKDGLALVVIDYIQLISLATMNNDLDEISYI